MGRYVIKEESQMRGGHLEAAAVPVGLIMRGMGLFGVWDRIDTLGVRIKYETMTRELRLKSRESRFAVNKKRWRGKGGLLLTSKKCNISHERCGDG